MQIKTFRGKSLNHALVGVKNELGKDAVLISSRTLSPKEANGADNIEVTVALDDQKQPMANMGTSSASAEVALAGIQQDIGHIRALMSINTAKETIPWLVRSNSHMRRFFERLLSGGVEETLALELLENLLERVGSDPDGATVKKELGWELKRSITVAKVSTNKKLRWALVGPTGAGKTTTLAKLAAMHHNVSGRSVGLITLDTYRLGAVEQLKAFARLGGLEMQVVYTKDELVEALRRYNNKDVVLLDTAGCSHNNLMGMNELTVTLKSIRGLENWLVLPATTKDEDLAQVSRRYLNLGLAGLIFTKLDETDSYGPLINQVLRFNLPVSFTTNGQRIPEDIEPATHERLLRLVLDGSKPIKGDG